jgi:hypothetical protein
MNVSPTKYSPTSQLSFTLEEFNGFAKTILINAPASPPDVRQGYALP